MDFSYPNHVDVFRTEVQELLAQYSPEDFVAATHGGTIHHPELYAELAARGWLQGAVPEELGGGGLDPLQLSVLLEELQLHRAPIDAMGVVIATASILLACGNTFLREEIVPKLLDGTSLTCFGYSEPESGSDVAAAQTKAVRDGDHWIITGQKMWTTMAHESDYVILLTRTNPDVPKHRGLTFFLVPLSLPGIEIQPVWTMGTERSNATFYDDVRVEDKWRIGEVDGGWSVMKTALMFERGIAGGQFPTPPVLHDGISWARENTDETGQPIIEDPVIREHIVRAQIDIEVCRVFAQHTASLAAEGAPFGVDGSMTKLFASESYKRATDWLADMMGPEAMLRHENPDAPLSGFVEENARHAPVTTIYGGTSEISRNLVAEMHLGLPRAR